jgi:hypothetical protein
LAGHQVPRTLLQQRRDQMLRNAVEAEAADRQRRATRNIRDGFGRGLDYLIHLP